MSAQQDRQGELRGLLLEIQSDQTAINHLIHTLTDIQKDDPMTQPSTSDQMALALCLHHLYTAMEQIFLRINKVYDKVPVSSESWHKELLRNMGMNIESVRPSVISAGLLPRIEEYRAFCHIVRHAYDYELDWSRLRPLVTKINDVIAQFQNEIDTFTSFVKENLRILEESE